VLATVREYRRRMRAFAGMRNPDVWYTHIEVEQLMPMLRSRVGRKMRKRLDRLVVKAQPRDSRQAYAKLGHVVDGVEQIISRPPLIVRLDDFAGDERDRLRGDIERLLRQYAETLPHDSQKLLEQYRLVDLARKVVGVGSVGTRAWIALFVGLDGHDPLFLQIKQAQASVLEEYVSGVGGFGRGGGGGATIERKPSSLSAQSLGGRESPDRSGPMLPGEPPLEHRPQSHCWSRVPSGGSAAGGLRLVPLRTGSGDHRPTRPSRGACGPFGRPSLRSVGSRACQVPVRYSQVKRSRRVRSRAGTGQRRAIGACSRVPAS
jgi:hypothetical protein